MPTQTVKPTAASIEAALAHCYGTERYIRHQFGKLVFTDGIDVLRQAGNCFWLVDLIASYQSDELDRKCDGFQVWTWKRVGSGGVVTCQADSNRPAIVTQEIPYSDFALDEFSCFVEGVGKPQPGNHGRVLLLKSEH